MEGFTVQFQDLTEEFILGNSTAVTEAPIDGKQYTRKDAVWDELVGAGGDMTKSTYDPTNKSADVFDYANFDNTPTTITAQQTSDISSNNSKVGVTNEEQNTINSEPIGNEVQVLQVVSISQANYDLITPVATTFYIIIP